MILGAFISASGHSVSFTTNPNATNPVNVFGSKAGSAPLGPGAAPGSMSNLVTHNFDNDLEQTIYISPEASLLLLAEELDGSRLYGINTEDSPPTHLKLDSSDIISRDASHFGEALRLAQAQDLERASTDPIKPTPGIPGTFAGNFPGSAEVITPDTTVESTPREGDSMMEGVEPKPDLVSSGDTGSLDPDHVDGGGKEFPLFPGSDTGSDTENNLPVGSSGDTGSLDPDATVDSSDSGAVGTQSRATDAQRQEWLNFMTENPDGDFTPTRLVTDDTVVSDISPSEGKPEPKLPDSKPVEKDSQD